MSQITCPQSCPLYNNGCYAEISFVGLHSKRLNASGETNPIEAAKEEAEGIKSLSGKFDMRGHVVGDSPNDACVKIFAKAVEEYKAKHGKSVWTYTHNHTTKRSTWGPVSVLRSCENTDQVKKSNKAGFAAAMVVPEFEKETAYKIDGVSFIPCPQQTGKADSCETCRLCMKDSKLLSIGANILFRSHGTGKNKVNEYLMKKLTTEQKSDLELALDNFITTKRLFTAMDVTRYLRNLQHKVEHMQVLDFINKMFVSNYMTGYSRTMQTINGIALYVFHPEKSKASSYRSSSIMFNSGNTQTLIVPKTVTQAITGMSKSKKSVGYRNCLRICMTDVSNAGFSPKDKVYVTYGNKSISLSKKKTSNASIYSVDCKSNIRIPVANLGTTFAINSKPNLITAVPV